MDHAEDQGLHTKTTMHRDIYEDDNSRGSIDVMADHSPSPSPGVELAPSGSPEPLRKNPVPIAPPRTGHRPSFMIHDILSDRHPVKSRSPVVGRSPSPSPEFYGALDVAKTYHAGDKRPLSDDEDSDIDCVSDDGSKTHDENGMYEKSDNCAFYIFTDAL